MLTTVVDFDARDRRAAVAIATERGWHNLARSIPTTGD